MSPTILVAPSHGKSHIPYVPTDSKNIFYLFYKCWFCNWLFIYLSVFYLTFSIFPHLWTNFYEFWLDNRPVDFCALNANGTIFSHPKLYFELLARILFDRHRIFWPKFWFSVRFLTKIWVHFRIFPLFV